MCGCLLIEFCALAILEFNGFGGEDACACGVNNVLDCGETSGEEGLEEFAM